jgi:hypothetical protein
VYLRSCLLAGVECIKLGCIGAEFETWVGIT